MAANRVGDVRVLQVVHDLRQPLAVLQLWTDLLRDGAVDPTTCANHCSRSLARMRLLVDALMTPPSEQPHVELSLAVVVEETLKELVAVADTRGVRLELRVHAAPTVIGDAGALYRAISNVVDNAVRYTPDNTTVRVTLDCVDGDAVVDIVDKGAGVPATLRDSVFEPFFTTRADGNGLGLATARSILHTHGGEISFIDDAGGHVRICLPSSVRPSQSQNVQPLIHRDPYGAADTRNTMFES